MVYTKIFQRCKGYVTHNSLQNIILGNDSFI